ncbi:hypothetical protein A3860_26465 [Niastella vici]|uniref:HD-CE domain-containing protein n=1 Tax=Niastella vici TaxID=1703345 RepID=A0A1V9FX44_9BACT|nr:ATP-binding protein [Niastella vici]OQP62858.1 hypothetical protein A3860_26465 [Niastella vici]
MVSIHLSQLKLYKKLLEKVTNDPVAGVLNGLIISLSGDAHELLGFIRNKFPSYTGHDLQHSWRIIKRLEDVISEEAIENLTPIEIFSLIIAAAFHDVGMIADGLSQDELRKKHHIKSDDFLNEFLTHRMANISEYLNRLTPCIGFIARSHGMTWEEMTSHEFFRRTERIFEQQLRVRVLSILLRIGDLLDLDSDRSCDPLRRYAPSYFQDRTSDIHHNRHKNVAHLLLTPENIEIEVISHTKEEHTIWTEWLGYLKQDILHANTYVFKGELNKFQLPKVIDKIIRDEKATYELWPLRFEIDEKGKIWDVISQSIYTSKFDFLRELIQNSIDACLRWIYIHPDGNVSGCNPKFWQLQDYEPHVCISFSELKNELVVSDNGVGMDKYALKHFLFNVASSGYKKEAENRNIPFPSIAKFGIGFVSCLVRADKIIVKTQSRENNKEGGRDVTLKTEALDAYSEIVDCAFGTQVKLYLKKSTTYNDILNYIYKNYYSPSVKIFIYNEDYLKKLIEILNTISFKGKSYDLKYYQKPENIEKLIQNTDYKELEDMLKSRKSENLNNLNKIFNFYGYIKPITEPIKTRLMNPVFLRLDNNFEIAGSSPNLIGKSNKNQVSLLFIPVFFQDNELGIEWNSIHIFIINRKSHEKTLFRYITSADRENDSILILTRSEYEDEAEQIQEDYDDNESEAYLDFGHEDTTEYTLPFNQPPKNKRKPDVFKIDSNIERISEKLHGIVTSESDGESEKPYDFVPGFKQNEENKQKASNYVSRTDKIIGDIDNMFRNLLTGDVFQDGIKLPIKASSIAPIGATHARCCLFGNSRFDLNVTRNFINESHALLGNWMSAAGKKIQKKILSKVNSVFEMNDIKYSPRDFIMEKSYPDPDIIHEYSTILLKSILEKF